MLSILRRLSPLRSVVTVAERARGAAWRAEQALVEQELDRVLAGESKRFPGTLLAHGFKVYSQCDEDGILEAIFARIGTTTRTFIEVGVGDGRENNSHYLLLQGWRGAWIDGDPANVSAIEQGISPPAESRLQLRLERVDAENAAEVVGSCLSRLDVAFDALDLFSLDIDGNDYFVLESLSDLRPRVFCVEYNAKFRPPLEVTIRYDPAHRWQGDDYYGASLCAWDRLLQPRGYRLVCCNVAGTNAFFVRADQMKDLVTADVGTLYQPPRHHLAFRSVGHRPSLRFLRDRCRADGAAD